MTTFNSIVLLITILIVVILLFFGIVWKLLDDIKGWQKSICDKLCSIRSDTVDIFQELNNIEDNILDEFIPMFNKLQVEQALIEVKNKMQAQADKPITKEQLIGMWLDEKGSVSLSEQIALGFAYDKLSVYLQTKED